MVSYFVPCGLVTCALGAASFFANRKLGNAERVLPEAWKRRYRRRLPVLIALGFVASVFPYPVMGQHGELYRVLGFPIPSAAFDAQGADYVSPLSLILIGLNVCTWALFPEIVIASLALVRRVKHALGDSSF